MRKYRVTLTVHSSRHRANLGPGVLRGRACHIISKFLAGSMLESVGNPQEYVYIMSLSQLEQILE